MRVIRLFHHFILEIDVDLKILQTGCLREFWAVPQEPDFSKVWNLCKNTVNNINFLYRPNSEKIND